MTDDEWLAGRLAGVLVLFLVGAHWRRSDYCIVVQVWSPRRKVPPLPGDLAYNSEYR